MTGMKLQQIADVMDRMVENGGCSGFVCRDCSANPGHCDVLRCPVVEALESLKSLAAGQSEGDAGRENQ